MHNQAPYRVVFLIIELTFEILIKILDSRQRAYCETRFPVVLAISTDKFGFLRIVFVIDLANDFLENVLDRHQAGNSTVFVNDNRHVIVTVAKLFQQCIEAL